MRKIIAASIVAAVGLTLAGPATADHEESCNGTVTAVETPAGTLYVDDRGIDAGGIWVYEESNDIADLQSGGTSLTLGEADPCEAVGHPTPDTLIL